MKKMLFIFMLMAGVVFAAPRFTDLGNGIIKDNLTNLFWQKCSAGQSGANCATGSAGTYTWANAKAYCAGLSLEGKTWRLPEITELLTLTDLSRTNPAINTGFFPATAADWYWSNTVVAGDPSDSWDVDFYYGYSYLSQTVTSRVRCVAP